MMGQIERAVWIIFFWLISQICAEIMKKAAPHDKIYRFWVNFIAALMTFYFICL